MRILVIDEVSFMSDSNLKNSTGNSHKLEIGPGCSVSIIFAGDFHQLEPICSKESDILFSSKSTQQWDQNINAIIILDNKRRFNEDPEYGKMLRRMWEGDLTLEDKQRINTRVIDKSFKPSDKLKKYIKHAKQKETILLTTRKDAMSQIKWM